MKSFYPLSSALPDVSLSFPFVPWRGGVGWVVGFSLLLPFWGRHCSRRSYHGFAYFQHE